MTTIEDTRASGQRTSSPAERSPAAVDGGSSAPPSERGSAPPALAGTGSATHPTRLPPRWFIRGAWYGHRAILRLTGSRRGLAKPRPDGRFGMLRLRTVGRQSGKERIAILGYHEDGTNLVTLAMNGWGDGEPGWWLNLLAHPEAVVDLKGGMSRRVRARAAVGEERARLWAKLHDDPSYGGDLDAFAALRSTETAVVVLEPVSR